MGAQIETVDALCIALYRTALRLASGMILTRTCHPRPERATSFPARPLLT
jgi:hypothetical protein